MLIPRVKCHSLTHLVLLVFACLHHALVLALLSLVHKPFALALLVCTPFTLLSLAGKPFAFLFLSHKHFLTS